MSANREQFGSRLGFILAAAGLIRLEMPARIRQFIAPEVMLPANGQGAVGIECRNDDAELIQLLAPLNHAETSVRVRAERAMNAKLNGGCQVPIGSYAVINGQELSLQGLVGSTDGKTILHAKQTGELSQAELIGEQVAEQLLKQGAAELLSALHSD